MTHSFTLSKERQEETPCEKDEQPSDYYYDDTTGYRVYDPEREEDDDLED